MKKYGVACVVGVAGVLACGEILPLPNETADASSPDGSTIDGAADDGGGGATDAGAEADADASAARPRVVFVTRKTLAGDFGGFASADALCTAEAADAGLGGSFVAWLSVAGKKPVDALSRLSDRAGGWSLVDGGEVFASKDAIATSTFPKLGIAQTAYGETTSGRAWTGTRPSGAAETADCTEWMKAAVDVAGVEGIVGAEDGTWTSAASDYCTNANHLICFEN